MVVRPRCRHRCRQARPAWTEIWCAAVDGGGAGSLGMACSVSLSIVAVWRISRTARLITDRYQLPRKARRTLTFAAMNDTALFDAWLVRDKGDVWG